MPTACPICGNANSKLLGSIVHPRPTLVAGVEIDLVDVDYSLAGCPSCEFQWKTPAINQDKLLACYAQAGADIWELNPDPHQRKFDFFRDVLVRHASGRRILDVGCFNGAFLQYLGDGWQRFGVEPSTSAAAVAQERGIEILAADLSEVDNANGSFDAVVVFDVVEHLNDPLPFFRLLHQKLAPDGVCLILTGDTHSLSWRLQGSKYWYCSLPEHVSFYCRATLRTIGDMLGLKEVECLPLCHKRLPLRWWASDTLKSAAYVAGRSVGGFGVPAIRRWVVDRRGPSIMSAKDHLLYVFRKP